MSFAESFIGRLRDECLNEHLFGSLKEARHIIEPAAAELADLVVVTEDDRRILTGLTKELVTPG